MPRRLESRFLSDIGLTDPKLRVRGWNIRVSYIDKGRLRYRRKLVSEFRYGGTKKSLHGHCDAIFVIKLLQNWELRRLASLTFSERNPVATPRGISVSTEISK